VEDGQRPEVLRQVATLLVKENDRLVREGSRLRAEVARLGRKTSGGVQQELEIRKELLDRREQELFGRSPEQRRVAAPESSATESPCAAAHCGADHVLALPVCPGAGAPRQARYTRGGGGGRCDGP